MLGSESGRRLCSRRRERCLDVVRGASVGAECPTGCGFDVWCGLDTQRGVRDMLWRYTFAGRAGIDSADADVVRRTRGA